MDKKCRGKVVCVREGEKERWSKKDKERERDRERESGGGGRLRRVLR